MDNKEKTEAQLMGRKIFNWVAGLAILLGLWWIGGYLLYINPDTTNFADLCHMCNAGCHQGDFNGCEITR